MRGLRAQGRGTPQRAQGELELRGVNMLLLLLRLLQPLYRLVGHDHDNATVESEVFQSGNVEFGEATLLDGLSNLEASGRIVRFMGKT